MILFITGWRLQLQEKIFLIVGGIQRKRKSLGVFYFVDFWSKIAEFEDSQPDTHKDG